MKLTCPFYACGTAWVNAAGRFFYVGESLEEPSRLSHTHTAVHIEYLPGNVCPLRRSAKKAIAADTSQVGTKPSKGDQRLQFCPI